MPINNAGLEIVKKWEGLRTNAYTDCVGVWTIGYGHTGTVDGKKICKGMKITEEKADELLKADMENAWNAVMNADVLPLTRSMNENQRSALCSFAFNVGTNCLRTISKNRDIGEIGDALTLYCKAGGKYKKGLYDRRVDKQKLYRKAVAVDMSTLRNGDKGQQVSVLQRLLNTYYQADKNALNVDGDFGRNTQERVKLFQSDNSLTADGVVGAKTWAVLLG